MSPQTALITGASSGIGEAFAHLYAERGHNLVLTGRNLDRLEALAEKLRLDHKITALVHVHDLADREAPQRLYDTLDEAGIDVDILVNNAGSALRGDFCEVAWSDSCDYLETMLVAICALTRLFVPAMRRRGYGRVILISSVSAFMPSSPQVPLYSGIKAFLNKLAYSLDPLYKPDGVRVIAACPGFTRTEFQSRAGLTDRLDAVPRFLWMDARSVAAAAILAAERPGSVHILGLRYKLIGVILHVIPDRLLAWLFDDLLVWLGSFRRRGAKSKP